MHMLTKATARTGLASYRQVWGDASVLVPWPIRPARQCRGSANLLLHSSWLVAASLSLPLSPCSDLVKDRLGLFAQTIHDLSIIANCFGALASLSGVWHSLPLWAAAATGVTF